MERSSNSRVDDRHVSYRTTFKQKTAVKRFFVTLGSLDVGAGWENRTPNHSLENCYYTI